MINSKLQYWTQKKLTSKGQDGCYAAKWNSTARNGDENSRILSRDAPGSQRRLVGAEIPGGDSVGLGAVWFALVRIQQDHTRSHVQTGVNLKTGRSTLHTFQESSKGLPRDWGF